MTSERRPRIAVINDDGITAKGFQSLAEAMTGIGDVYVIAPDSPPDEFTPYRVRKGGSGFHPTLTAIVPGGQPSPPAKSPGKATGVGKAQ